MDAMPGKVELPEWPDCELACDERRASALEEFIYEYEPSNGDEANEWRERLRRLVTVAPNTRQRAERAARAWLTQTGLLTTDEFNQGVQQLAGIIAAEFEK